MGLKSGAIENTLGEHIENLINNLGTWSEHISNPKKEKKNLSPPPPSPQNPN